MFYHKYIKSDLETFKINYKQSDLFIGTNRSNSPENTEIISSLKKKLMAIYVGLEAHIKQYPNFKTSLYPVEQNSEINYIVEMIRESECAKVGPMAAVAGMVSDEMVNLLKKEYKSCFCENGGDIATDSEKEISLIVFPGSTDFNTKIKIIIPPGRHGIASSGKAGHSLSLGQADLVSVGANNAIRADAFATAIANRVKKGKDNAYLVEEYSFLDYVLIVEGEKIWYKGNYEIEFVK